MLKEKKIVEEFKGCINGKISHKLRKASDSGKKAYIQWKDHLKEEKTYWKGKI